MPLILLCDAVANVLWAERSQFSVKVGQPLWEALELSDPTPLQAFVMRFIAAGGRQSEDVGDVRKALWRITLMPTAVGVARIVATVAEWPKGLALLTDAERDVCAMAAEGLTVKQVAARRGVTRSTVDVLRHKAASRIGITSGALDAWCGRHAEWFTDEPVKLAKVG
jgi:DNA-binding CsgD family transcriptional regulator